VRRPSACACSIASSQTITRKSDLTEIRFYHLTATTLDRALPRILEKALAGKQRAVVVAGSRERAKALDAQLWTYEENSFLPHGLAPAAGEDEFAADHPIWLTTKVENPNGAGLLVLIDSQTVDAPEDWKLVCEIFDGNDDEALAAARTRWKALKAGGHDLAYWRQTEAGGWEKAG
jgi:DNA polymerase III subunit chi